MAGVHASDAAAARAPEMDHASVPAPAPAPADSVGERVNKVAPFTPESIPPCHCFAPGCTYAKATTYLKVWSHMQTKHSWKIGDLVDSQFFLEQVRLENAAASRQKYERGPKAKKAAQGSAQEEEPVPGGCPPGPSSSAVPTPVPQPPPQQAPPHTWRVLPCYVKFIPEGAPMFPLEVYGIAEPHSPQALAQASGGVSVAGRTELVVCNSPHVVVVVRARC